VTLAPLRTLVAGVVISGLLLLPGPSYAQARKGDVLIKVGPPQQVMQVDGDEFWIYRWVAPSQNPLNQIGAMLQGFSAAVQGRAYIPQGQMEQHMLILRFGPDGELKAYEQR